MRSLRVPPSQAAEIAVGEDPASAWRRITGGGEHIHGATRLKKNNRTQVYRLESPAWERGVIAKRCRERVALLEHAVYSRILDARRLRVPALYGFGKDPFTEDDHTYYWLFIEDLGPRRHDPSNDEERRRLAHWLGVLGASTVDTSQSHGAPERLLPYYRAFRDDAADGLSKLAEQRSFQPSVRGLIDDAVRTLGRIEAGWSRIEALANSAPPIIAHGDCLAKNIHVTLDPDAAVIPIDWGSVGVGLPGADLGVSSVSFEMAHEVDPCIDAYVAAIKPAWPDASAALVRDLAHSGRMLWVIKLLAQSLPGFEFHSAVKCENYIRLYVSLLKRSSLDLSF
jgi:hypothetical protein